VKSLGKRKKTLGIREEYLSGQEFWTKEEENEDKNTEGATALLRSNEHK